MTSRIESTKRDSEFENMEPSHQQKMHQLVKKPKVLGSGAYGKSDECYAIISLLLNLFYISICIGNTFECNGNYYMEIP
ncbi:hypothetical protein BC941DRAFT_516358 [Chlamydoabsidia padenii]|nr:hypothetical protein BC941DRAFT_516358 [Chlamydoabsidia padenii]